MFDNDFHNAGVIFLRDRKILVTKPVDRSAYLIPGGGIEDGENPMDTAKREIIGQHFEKLHPS